MSNIDKLANDNYDPKSIFKRIGKLPPKERLLRWKHVQPRVGICRSYAHRLAKQGKFLAPIKLLGGKVAAWVESEVSAWVDEQIASRPQVEDKEQKAS